MNGSLVASIYALATSVILAAVSYWLTKAKEYEADLRKLRFDFYREFVVSLAQMPDEHATDIDRIRFNTATNALYLVGPSDVLKALTEFRLATGSRNKSHGETRMTEFNETYQKLLWAIRRDLRLPVPGTPKDLEIAFWAAIPPKSNK